jgi:hypothetical protein
MGGTRYDHPAYGVIRTSQPQGNTVLFGTDFVHHNFITLTICQASRERQYHEDRVFGEKVICEIDMSEAQWAHFVSSHGQYSGTPVTLRHVPDRTAKLEQVPGLPHRDSTNSFDPETRARIKDVDANLERLTVLLTDSLSKLSKADRAEALGFVTKARQQIGPNLKFVEDQLTEHLDTKITNAKLEVYAWMDGAVRAAGLESIHSRQAPIEIEGPDANLDV